ncbi:hypothetical protein D0864_15868 [Hortaea werneckii]|uniref:Uncharacterized protein n=1 Tax=Hortaea werneckii TaxID=91943 RepID=A0A3M7BU43_HORWE|nr:hypothetical protein D0864_15868 [Hortaea werneckii]
MADCGFLPLPVCIQCGTKPVPYKDSRTNARVYCRGVHGSSWKVKGLMWLGRSSAGRRHYFAAAARLMLGRGMSFQRAPQKSYSKQNWFRVKLSDLGCEEC